ncbi:MAG: H-X9-DG-CTERM domain-containing protein [Armatimonadota bacterium]
MMMAALMYTQDYDQRLPIYYAYYPAPGVTWPGGGVSRNVTWMVLIHPYVKNQGVFDCPSSEVRWNGNYAQQTSYGWNRALMHYSPLMYAFRMRDVAEPASHPALADTAGPISFWVRDTIQVTSGGPDGYVDDRHNGGANIGFLDGHAKWAGFNLEENLSNLRNDIPGVSPWWRARP